MDPANWFLGPAVRDADDGAADDGSGAVGGSWADVEWRSLLNVLFWNLNYYDSASAFAGKGKSLSIIYNSAFKKNVRWLQATVTILSRPFPGQWRWA